MMVSIEGIIYAITSKSRFVYNVFESILDFDKIIKKTNENKIKRINTIYKHEDFCKAKKNISSRLYNWKKKVNILKMKLKR